MRTVKVRLSLCLNEQLIFVFLVSELAFSPNDNTVHIHKRAGNKWDKGFVLSEVWTINNKMKHSYMYICT